MVQTDPSSPFHGIYPILYAFYDGDGQLDRAAMRRQVRCCIDAGAHGIAVLGLITEVGRLSPEERITVIEWAAEDIGEQAPLAVTIAGETPAEQIALARKAAQYGAHWLILQPPQRSKPGEAALLRFFGQVMESTALPVGIQNFPEVLGVGLTPRAVGELHRQHPNFTVMKGEGPVYQIRQYMDAADGGVSIFNGRGGIELPDNLRAGCAGIIPAPDCADVQIAMYDSFVAGDFEQLDRLYAAHPALRDLRHAVGGFCAQLRQAPDREADGDPRRTRATLTGADDRCLRPRTPRRPRVSSAELRKVDRRRRIGTLRQVRESRGEQPNAS